MDFAGCDGLVYTLSFTQVLWTNQSDVYMDMAAQNDS